MSLCKYKDVFGKPHEGFHKYRILNMALFDLIGTIFIGLLISYFCNQNALLVIIILLLLSVIFHNLFCVNTTLTKYTNNIIKNLSS